MLRLSFISLIALMASQPSSADMPRGDVFEQAGVRIAGTTWIADDGPLDKVTYYFHPSGVLVYTYAKNGSEYRNGTWKQQGDILYFEANHRFREFRAQIHGHKITGPSWNKAGSRWTTTLTPKRK